MTLTVKNGERRDVHFEGRRGSYRGLAAVERGEKGPWRVCLPARRSDLNGVTRGTVGGAQVRVLGLADSNLVRGLLVLTVAPDRS